MATETNIHREARLAKLKTLQERGYNPYPYSFHPTAYAADLQEKYKDLEAGTDTEDRVTIAGRAMAVRNNGMFIDVKDSTGKIQAFCHKNHLSEDELERLKCLDVGDIVGISGYVRRTPRGELSIAAEKFDIISKSLQPLPEKFHGLTDVEARYRQRYVDFIMNDESREIYKKRCEITSAIRRYFEAHNFLEVETPMLHPIMAAPMPNRLSRIITRWIWTCICALLRSCISKSWLSAVLSAFLKSDATSATKALTRAITRNLPLWKLIRPMQTITPWRI